MGIFMKKTLVLFLTTVSVFVFAQPTTNTTSLSNNMGVQAGNFVSPLIGNQSPTFSITTNEQEQLREVVISPFPGIYMRRIEPIIGGQQLPATTGVETQQGAVQNTDVGTQAGQEVPEGRQSNNIATQRSQQLMQPQAIQVNNIIDVTRNTIQQQPQPEQGNIQEQRTGQTPPKITHIYTTDMSFFNQATIRELEQAGKKELEKKYNNFLIHR